MGADQPGTIAADVNLRLNSAYYIGVGDYSVNTWHWYGPFAVSHSRFNVPPAAYTSGLGNLMLAVVAYDGANFDLVGLGVNAHDNADTTAPPTPSAPTLTAVAGGVLAEWVPVVESDLAGYRIYADGNNIFNYIEGGTSTFIPATGDVEVALSAIDVSGNESAQSEPTTATPLAGDIPAVQLTASSPSGMRGDVIALTASGADSYDWDTDGDGTWDITDDATGSAFAATTDIGIIRPALRAHTTGDGFWIGAVSLIIGGNSRPVVSVSASPQSGTSPLSVIFTITAEDDDGLIAEYAWDFDGDGVFDDNSAANPSPLPHDYLMSGTYNAKIRVTDNEGSWDVDSVSIQVLPEPDNLMPIITAIAASPTVSVPLSPVNFTAVANDPDGSVIVWEWDFENDGLVDSTEQNPSFAFASEGLYTSKLTVTDNDGDYAVGYTSVAVQVLPGNIPPSIIDTRATPEFGRSPLTVTFTSSATDSDGTIALFEWDFENDASFDYSDGNNGDTTHDYMTAGFYTARLRVTDNEGAVSNAYIGIDVSNNLPPVAALKTEVTTYYLGETGSVSISFDASDSYDPDGSNLSYNFDPEGDGSFEDNLTDPTYDFVYEQSGVFLAALKVVDERGDYDYASLLITIYIFSPLTLDSTGTVGSDLSAAVINGNPAVSYRDNTNGSLKFIRALNPSGTSWGNPVTAVGGGGQGYCTSLAQVNGYPAVSYYDWVYADLIFVRATNASGSSWGTPVSVDSTGTVGFDTSLTIVDGNPAISYHDAGNFNLKYCRATDANGAVWGTPTIVDSAGFVGRYTSMAVVNGNPAISYFDETNYDLKYVRALNVSGSSWGTPVTVDSNGYVGYYTSLKVVNGNPAICYADSAEQDLYYIRATDTDGSTWGTRQAIDYVGDVGMYCCLAIINGHPAISYTDQSNNCLKYIFAGDDNGDVWMSPMVVNAMGSIDNTWLVEAGGRPGISYYDSSLGDLKFARPKLD